MLDFELGLKAIKYTFTPNELLSIAQARCEELRGYGFCAQIHEKPFDNQGPCKKPDDEERKTETDAIAVRIHITGPDGKCYVDDNVDLTPGLVKQLSQFATKAHVQHTLDELAPRMVLLGYDVTTITKRLDSVGCDYIRVTLSGNKSNDYALTYGDMMRLRRDVDIAEVDFLVGKAWPKLQEAGYQRLTSEGSYAFCRPEEKGFVTIPFGQVGKAKEVLKDLKTKLATRSTT